MRDAVQKWLESGAEVQAGLRLLSLYAKNEHLAQLVTARPDRYKSLLIDTLCKAAGTSPLTTPPPSSRPAFREQWTFLSEPDCPPELKILAADKITAYRDYVDAHRRLFDCTTLDECFATAENLIKSFSENRKILYEFTYYAEHQALLGRHSIFREMQELATLRKMGPVALVARQKNLKGSIWRIKHEITRGSKPHLDIERRNRLKAKERELAAVNKMIEEYERTIRP